MKLTWKKATAILTFIVLLGGSVAVLKEYRFWAWAGDLEQIAGVSYKTAISRERDVLRETQLFIDKCTFTQSCPSATMLRLQRQRQEILDRIRILEQARDQISSGG